MKAARILIGATSTLLCCVSLTRLAAQDDPTPKEPLIARAPDRSAWTVTYRYKPAEAAPKPDGESKQKPPDQIVSVQMQKTGKIYHRITAWSSGVKSEAWSIGPREVIKPKADAGYTMMSNDGPATDDYSTSDFEDIAWITMKNYAGFKKGEQSVFVFQAKNSERPLTRREKYSLVLLSMPRSAPKDPKAPTGSPNASPAKPDPKAAMEEIYGTSTATVVLDATTQLPVAYDDGRTVLVYQFNTPPADTLVPPPEVTSILRRYEDYLKANKVRPSAP